jgi:hypothetical protein
MKTMTRVIFISLLLIVAVSAYSQECVQMWKCEMNDETTEEMVIKMAHEWLNAAKKVKGGENFKAFVYFPVAVNATGEMDIMFIIVAPSFEEWGRFWDNYQGSAVAELEMKQAEWIVCPDSVVWEATEIK